MKNWNALPLEALDNAFSLLSLEHVIQCQLVCKQWQKTAERFVYEDLLLDQVLPVEGDADDDNQLNEQRSKIRIWLRDLDINNSGWKRAKTIECNNLPIDALPDLIRKFPTIKSLSVGSFGRHIKDNIITTQQEVTQFLSYVYKIPNFDINHLYITNHHFISNALKQLWANSDRLHTLNLEISRNDDSIFHFRRYEQETEAQLFCGMTRGMRSYVDILKNCGPYINELSLQGNCPIEDSVIDYFQGKPLEEDGNIQYFYYALDNCKNLVTLNVSKMILQNDGDDKSHYNSSIKELCISECRISKAAAENWSRHLSNLTHLEIEECEFNYYSSTFFDCSGGDTYGDIDLSLGSASLKVLWIKDERSAKIKVSQYGSRKSFYEYEYGNLTVITEKQFNSSGCTREIKLECYSLEALWMGNDNDLAAVDTREPTVQEISSGDNEEDDEDEDGGFSVSNSSGCYDR